MKIQRSKHGVLRNAVRVLLASSALPLVAPGIAHAQSSVALYGMIDSGVSYATHSSASGSGLFSAGNGAIAPSRFGFRMSEDIGGQTRVIANLEAGFSPTTGASAQSGRMFGRTSIVGVEGRFGRLTFGREYTVLYEAIALNDVYVVSNSPMAGFVIGNYTAGTRLDNGVKYQGHVGAFSAGVQYNFTGSSTLPQGSSTGVRVAYDQGPLHLGAAYQSLNDKTSFFGVTIPSTNQKVWTVGGTYTFTSDKLFFYYTHSQLTGYLNQLATLGESHAFAPDLSWRNAVAFDHMSRDAGSGNRVNVSTELVYSLSKRTSVYGLVDYTQLSGTWRSFAALPTFTNSFYGASNRLEAVAGIVHRF